MGYLTQDDFDFWLSPFTCEFYLLVFFLTVEPKCKYSIFFLKKLKTINMIAICFILNLIIYYSSCSVSIQFKLVFIVKLLNRYFSGSIVFFEGIKLLMEYYQFSAHGVLLFLYRSR